MIALDGLPLVATYSIVARDPASGELGVAVQSRYFSVGRVVPWAEAGVGAVATQSWAEPSYGALGLDLMRAEVPAPAVLAALLATDEGRERRQVAMVDAEGRVAAHTGSLCVPAAGAVAGEQFSAQGNLLWSSQVWAAAADGFRAAAGDLAMRLLAALDAAQAAGGDLRGRQSAAILVVGPQRSGRPWDREARRLDLRVEDHPEPLVELRRLLLKRQAYRLAEQADTLLGAGSLAEALETYQEMAALAPDEEQLLATQGLALLRHGHDAVAAPALRAAFARNPGLREMARRMLAAGLLAVEPARARRALGID